MQKVFGLIEALSKPPHWIFCVLFGFFIFSSGSHMSPDMIHLWIRPQPSFTVTHTHQSVINDIQAGLLTSRII